MNPAAAPIDWTGLAAVAATAAVMVFLVRRLMRGMNQQDWILLRQTRARGINPSVPQSVDFVLFLATENAAHSVAEELRKHGFETGTKQAQIQYARPKKKPGEPQAGYLVTATRTLALVPAELGKLRKHLNEVAGAQQGIYCGWQVSDGARTPQPASVEK